MSEPKESKQPIIPNYPSERSQKLMAHAEED